MANLIIEENCSGTFSILTNNFSTASSRNALSIDLNRGNSDKLIFSEILMIDFDLNLDFLFDLELHLF
jgi:hypothetical protein